MISGKGFASKMHSRIKSSPSCLIEGFLGNRGGIPSGILGLSPPEPEKVHKKGDVSTALYPEIADEAVATEL